MIIIICTSGENAIINKGHQGIKFIEVTEFSVLFKVPYTVKNFSHICILLVQDVCHDTRQRNTHMFIVK